MSAPEDVEDQLDHHENSRNLDVDGCNNGHAQIEDRLIGGAPLE